MRKRISAATFDVIAAVPGVAGIPPLHGDEPGDEYLISALADDAVWAMDLLYQRYSRLLYSLAYRIVGDLRVAEDLVQEVFLAVWQNFHSYIPQSGSVSAWLTSIMRHRAYDHLRRVRRRHISQEVSWDADEQDPRTDSPDLWDEAWRSVQGELVRECLMRLQPEQRAVIELAYFEGRTQSEIASSCQIPLGTVKARMRLALRHLKRELEKRGVSGL
ncbi:MAG TPA: sigma-70 family RNA polymerase sigma factor [Ktedonobacteraceae bacterium]